MTDVQHPSSATAVPRALLVLLLIAMAISAELSRLLAPVGQNFSVIFPPSGMALAACIAFGWRGLLAASAGLLLWSMTMPSEWPHLLPALLGIMLGTYIAARCICRTWQRPTATNSNLTLNHLPLLYGFGAGLGAAIAALFGTIGYVQMAPESFSFLAIWLMYWLFEALGVILFTPIALRLLLQPMQVLQALREDSQEPKLRYWLCLVLLLFGVSLWLTLQQRPQDASHLSLLIYPLLCWFALQARAPSVDLLVPLCACALVFVNINAQQFYAAVTPEIFLQVLIQTGVLVAMSQLIALTNQSRLALIAHLRGEAATDLLTGFANERGFVTQLQHLKQSKPNSNGVQQHWLWYIRLQDYPISKSLLGVRAVSQMEQQWASKLRASCPADWQLARMQEGDYAILLTIYQAPADGHVLANDITSLAAQIQRQMSSLQFDNQQLRLRPLLSLVPLDQQLPSAEDYLTVAQQGLQQAKHSARQWVLVQQPQDVLAQIADTRFQFQRLLIAMEDSRLTLFAQPIVPVVTLDASDATAAPTLLRFEILLRLRDHDGQWVAPGQFLPALEAYGFMPELDRWVIKQTFKTLAATSARECIAKCAINLSASSFSDPELPDFIQQQLAHYQLPPAIFTFEITESEAIKQPDVAQNLVHRLHQLGVKLALDDFGTGYASFQALKLYAFDELKIDGFFVRELLHNEQDQAFVAAIATIANKMQLSTVAEFVDSQATCDLLAQLGVDFAQGYGVGKPIPLTQLLLNAPAADDLALPY